MGDSIMKLQWTGACNQMLFISFYLVLEILISVLIKNYL